VDVPWWLLLIGLEFPAVVALIDCLGRPDHHFAEGAEDKRSWVKWLVVAIVTVPILVGYLLLVGYYHVVVRRNSPFNRS
jgi:hypothetical protein